MTSALFSLWFFVAAPKMLPLEHPLQRVFEASELARGLSGAEALVALVPPVTDQVNSSVSACTGFSYLISRLYERESGEIADFTALGATFLGDLQEFGIEMNLAEKKTPQSIEFLKDAVRAIFKNIFKIHGEKPDLSHLDRFFARDSAALQRLHSLRNRAVSGKWNWAAYPWLTSHQGAFPDSQSKTSGYLQLKGDSDGNGRHDHLIAGLFLGRLFESQTDLPLKGIVTTALRRALYLHEFYSARAFDWSQQVENNWRPLRSRLLASMVGTPGLIVPETIDLSLRVSKAAAQIYGVLLPQRAGVVLGSATDAHVNMEAFRLGQRLVQESLTADELDAEVFKLLCDETEISPRFKGPLSPHLQEAARTLR